MSVYRSSSLTSPNTVCASGVPSGPAATICPLVCPTGAFDPSPVTVVDAVPCAGTVRAESARVATPSAAPWTESFSCTSWAEELR